MGQHLQALSQLCRFIHPRSVRHLLLKRVDSKHSALGTDRRGVHLPWWKRAFRRPRGTAEIGSRGKLARILSAQRVVGGRQDVAAENGFARRVAEPDV